MPVTENKIIEMLRTQYFLAINNQPFIVLSQELFVIHTRDGPAAAAGPIGDTHANGGRQNTKEPLAHPVAKYLLHELISMIAGTQPISMPNIKSTAIVFKGLGLVIHRYVELLLEIAAHPHIVIAHKKMYGDTRVRDLSHLAQYPRIPLRHHGTVLVPEVEQVAYNKYPGCVPANGLQKANNVLFPYQAGGMVGSAQVHVGEKIDLFSWRDLHGVKLMPVYQKKVNFFWAMHPHDERLLYIRRTAGTCSEGDQGR